MAKYQGLGQAINTIRDTSIDVDDDDLSDVEDDIFIRDGKMGYQFVRDDARVPLMTSRNKSSTLFASHRSKHRSNTFSLRLRRKLCAPGCRWIFISAGILGFLVLLAFESPPGALRIADVRQWFTSKAICAPKMLQCDKIGTHLLWKSSLPLVSSDSPLRSVDVDLDGISDIIMGFGALSNGPLPKLTFCEVYLGVHNPCDGGVVALNGSTGSIIWRYWMNDTAFGLQCSEDVTQDNVTDCLVMGTSGSLIMLDSKNGLPVWQKYYGEVHVLVANFIHDINNDSFSDVIAAYGTLDGSQEGKILLLSGTSGHQIRSISLANDSPTFYMPQLIKQAGTNLTEMLLIGTGRPGSTGNLLLLEFSKLMQGDLSSAKRIYQDQFDGVFSQSILVDITGDGIFDIVTGMHNSTIIAINGRTFTSIWNFSVPNSISNVTPAPAYFNDDNVTDFLIMYKHPDGVFSKIYVIDGKNGTSIYEKPIFGGVTSQMSALAVSMMGRGSDLFTFWTIDCMQLDNETEFEGSSCSQSATESTPWLKLNALNQYDQPPGFPIFSTSQNWSMPSLRSPLEQMRNHLSSHGTYDMDTQEKWNLASDTFRSGHVHKQQMPSHNRYSEPYFSRQNKNLDVPYTGVDNSEDYGLDDTFDGLNSYKDVEFRGPRDSATNKDPVTDATESTSPTIADIFGYDNIVRSKARLFDDDRNVPTDILTNVYFETREKQLQASEQHPQDTPQSKQERSDHVERVLDKERHSLENRSYTLWDIEDETELEAKFNGRWPRTRRQSMRMLTQNVGSVKIAASGILAKSLHSQGNAIDAIFAIYWQPPELSIRELVQNDIEKCIVEKSTIDSKDKSKFEQSITTDERNRFFRECVSEHEELKKRFPHFEYVLRLRFGQLTVYRVRLDCECNVVDNDEKCTSFLSDLEQHWPSFLGRKGDGIY